MSTLYRKYRPQKFSDITGQDPIVRTIVNEITANKLAHAYLFSGPRGVGKTTLARLLAKAANCQNRKENEAEPCDQCSSCSEITAGRSIDVVEIDAASQTGVENVRENIIDSAQFKPTSSKYKIFIIDEVHMLSTPAFNALLKTLEEPPAHVFFILATTEPHKLLPTIISRCQRFQFHKIPHAAMLERLKKICADEDRKVDTEVLEKIIAKSDGCERDAESLLGQILSLDVKKITAEEALLFLPSSEAGSALNFLEKVINHEAGAAIELLQSLLADGVNPEQFAHDLLEMTHILLVAKATGKTDQADLDEKNAKKIKKIIADLNLPSIIRLVELTLKRKNEIKISPLPQLPLELLAVEFSSLPVADGSAGAAGTGNVLAADPKIAPATNNTAAAAVNPTEKIKHCNIGETIKTAISSLAGKRQIKTDLQTIRDKWPEFINKISESNHSLTFILKMCQIKNTEEGSLNLTIPYRFHQEKLEEIKNKKIIEDCLSEIFSERIAFSCQVSQAAAGTDANPELNNLAAEFGGEIIS